MSAVCFDNSFDNFTINLAAFKDFLQREHDSLNVSIPYIWQKIVFGHVLLVHLIIVSNDPMHLHLNAFPTTTRISSLELL